MIQFFDGAVFFLGWYMFFVGCLFSFVLIIFLIDEGISMLTKYLKVYPILIQFIWDRVHKKEARP